MTKSNELKPYRIKSTGETVMLRRSMSYSMLMMALMKQHPKPTPPMQVVELAGQKQIYPNYADPDYTAAVEMWNGELAVKASDIMLKSAVVVEMTPERKAAVKQFRELMGDTMQLNEPDSMVWLRYIALANDHDVTDLIAAIRNISQPTEQAVEEAAEGF